MNAKIAAIVLIKKNAPISINCTQKSKKSGWEVIFFQLKKLLKKPKNGSIIKVRQKNSPEFRFWGAVNRIKLF